MDRQKIEKLGTFILGGVAGTVAGILISPRSGRELRGAMSHRAGETRERGREGYFEARERARERLSGLREAGLRETGAVDEEVPVGETFPGGPEPEDLENMENIPGSEEAAGEPAGRLRAVPPEEEPGDSEEESEALRLRIRQTRDRLRRQGPGGPGGGGVDG
jgi:hypothetical protein